VLPPLPDVGGRCPAELEPLLPPPPPDVGDGVPAELEPPLTVSFDVLEPPGGEYALVAGIISFVS
jgi:hypothetical protein